jgi:hypothetical protein
MIFKVINERIHESAASNCTQDATSCIGRVVAAAATNHLKTGFKETVLIRVLLTVAGFGDLTNNGLEQPPTSCATPRFCYACKHDKKNQFSGG